jgi:hypothetical protein
MRSALRSLLNSGIVDFILDAIGEVAEFMDDLLDDVRELDVSQPLAPQLMELLLDRVEEAVEAMFGDDPHIDLEFSFSWEYDEPVFVGPAPWDWSTRRRTVTQPIDLGRIDIPLDTVLSVVRSAGRGLGVFESIVRDAADALTAAFAAESDLNTKETEKAGLQGEQKTLEKRRAEVAPGPRSVSIVSPAPMEVIDRPVVFRIRIEGVPDSIMEEGPDTPARILVFLNGEPVPLSNFSASALTVVSAAPPITRGFRPDIAIRAPLLEGGKPGPGRKGHPIAGSVFRLSGAGGVVEQHGSRAVGDRPGLAVALEKRRESVAARLASEKAARAKVRATGGVRLTAGDVGSVSKNSKRDLFDFTPPNLGSLRGLGRRLSVARLNALGSSGGPGIMMTRTVLPSELSDGVNSLSIVLLDGLGNRTEASVSFVASVAARSPRGHVPWQPGITLLPAHIKPIVIAGSRGLLPPKKKRQAAVTAAKVASAARRAAPADPLKAVRILSTKVAARLPERMQGPRHRDRGADGKGHA